MIPAGHLVLSVDTCLNTRLGSHAHTVIPAVVNGIDIQTWVYDTLPRMSLFRMILDVQRVSLTFQQVTERLVDGKVVTTVNIVTLIELAVLSTGSRILELGSVIVALHHTTGQRLLNISFPVAVHLRHVDGQTALQ